MSKHSTAAASKQLLALIGDPKEVARRLDAFGEAEALFSSEQAQFIAHYLGKWVAVHGSEVCAHSRSFTALMAMLDAQDIPRGDVMVRHIERQPRRMILPAC